MVQDTTQAEPPKEPIEVKGQIAEDSKALDEEDKAQEVVKKVKVTSDYFNTLTQNEHEPKLIKAIIDEDVKATDGSRVRLRLLDDIEIGETMVKKGSYLYATMSGFGSQRVKGSINSILVDDELIKVSLSLYDTDGLEGLYVPGSQFRETTKDVASGAMQSNMNIDQSGANNSFSQVTTVITASEPIRFVDISTDKVVGDQPINNIIRLKPKDNVYADGEVLAIVTIVTERYRTQYALLYTTRMQEAVTDKEIECSERNAYNNPAVSLSTADMTKYARQIWSSAAKYRNVATKMHRMVMRLNNIYSVGEYFFIDFSVENKTDYEDVLSADSFNHILLEEE